MTPPVATLADDVAAAAPAAAPNKDLANRTVLFRVRGHVAVITLNRPQALNAVNSRLAAELGAALERLDADPDLRVGVLASSTDRAFCAGADLKALAAGQPVHDPAHPEWGFAGIARHNVVKPLVAAVEGGAFGGGMEILLACDLVIAGAGASFALPEVTRGLLAGAGGLVRLPGLVPPRAALEAALTGDAISAATAAGWGLVNRVVPHGRALTEAMTLAARIAENAPLAVQASKRLIRAAGSGLKDTELWRRNAAEIDHIFATADAAEGMSAFAERRPPRWQGA